MPQLPIGRPACWSLSTIVSGVLLLGLGACAADVSRTGTHVTGTEITDTPAESPAATSVWGGVYSEAQAERGEAVYRQECEVCHLPDLRGQQMSPSLVGVGFSFRWRGQTLNELFSSLKSTMPQAAPGSLTPQAYVDVMAFLLQANDFPSGASELRADSAALGRIEIDRKPR